MYRRIRGIGQYTIFWYILGFPYDLLHLIILLVRHKSIKRYYLVKRRINIVRKQCKELRGKGTESLYTKSTQTKDTIKIYYKYTDTAILIKFRMIAKAVQIKDYEKFVESCHILTGLKNTNYVVNNKDGYAYFKLFEEPIPKHEIIVNQKEHGISIGTGFEGIVMWYFDKVPHCLIVGETGSGKSTFMAYLISSLLRLENIKIWMLDGKVVDYSLSKRLFYRYMANKNTTDNLEYLKTYYNLMLERYNLMAEKGVKNYKQLNLEPYILIIDEFIDVVERCGNTKEGKLKKEEIKSMIGSISRLGRAAGMQLIISMQRPDTTFIDGNTRDQFQLRIVLGGASSQAYTMAFEEHDLKRLTIGKAWYRMGSVLDVISIPLYENIESKEISNERN